MQTEYALKLVVNGRTLSRVDVDDHCKLKHSEHQRRVDLKEMVKTLNGRTYLHEKVTPSGWEIYTVDPVHLEGNPTASFGVSTRTSPA